MEIWHLRIKHTGHLQSISRFPDQRWMSNVKKCTLHWTHWWRDALPKVGSSLSTTPTSAKRNTRSMPWGQSKMHLERLGRWEVCGDQVTPQWAAGMLCSELPGPHIIHHSLLRATWAYSGLPSWQVVYRFLFWAQGSFFFHLWSCLTLQGSTNHIFPTLPDSAQGTALNTLMLYVWPSKNFPSEQDADKT